LKKPSVDIIILHHNGIDNIDNCLKSVLKTKYANFNIIIVDNNSTDGSIKVIEKKYKPLYIIRNRKNYGYAKGNNIGIMKSNAKYVVLLNDDTIVKSNWLDELVKVAESNNKIATCQPKVLSLHNKKYFDNCGAGSFLDYYGYPIYRGRVFDYREIDKGQYDNPSSIFFSVGVCTLMRKSVLDEVGLLDEDFHIYFEEFDLCWRMNLRGYIHKSVPSAVIYHIGGVTYKKKSFKWSYLNHRNSMIMLLKNYSFATILWVMPLRIFFELISMVRFLFGSPSRALAVLLAILWVFTHPFTILKKHRKTQKLRILEDKDIMRMMVSRSAVIQHFIFRKKYFNEFEGYIKAFKENE